MSKFIIGVDLGATNLKVALLDQNYQILYKNFYKTQNLKTKKKIIDKIQESIQDIICNKKIARDKLLGIGMGVPGPVDYEKGKVYFFPNIPGWKNVRLKTILEKKIKLPVFVDNDANLMCLAEARIGAAKKSKNAVCLTLGTGVGGGIIINQQLYRG
ncbi:MAG: ROK family protein, partial [Candidatus Omnitrophica bacterium]|nr:ROK family protein [Candidatus Omnitrophota bacterium]